jgi:hypothetical protein
LLTSFPNIYQHYVEIFQESGDSQPPRSELNLTTEVIDDDNNTAL